MKSKCILGGRMVVNAPVNVNGVMVGTTDYFHTVRMHGKIVFESKSFDEACEFAAKNN